MKKRSAPRRQLLVEELEPRILYSADVATLFGAGLWTPGAEVRVVEAAAPPASSPQPAVATVQQSAREIVFIDSRVPDAIKLADELMQQRGIGHTFDIVMLDAADDGIAQINRVLAGEHDLAAIHIISHGSAGALQLGSSLLDADELSRNSTAVSAWGRVLSTDGDLLLYGCDVGQGAVGRAFIGQLAQLTGADVAASNNRTGSAVSGGDWTLEVRAGAIETAVALDADLQGAFAGALDITTGLKGLWRFDADATDASGNGYNGTLTNGALIDTTAGTNKVGAGKVSLDGVNDYVDLSAHLASFSSLSQGTISAWIKTSATDGTIFELSDLADANSYASLWVYQGKLAYTVSENSTYLLDVVTAASVNDNVWHQVAVTMDATGNTLYIDGVKQTSLTYYTGNAATRKFHSDVTGVDFMGIGAEKNSTGLHFLFTGLIDDVRVYDRALSAADIAQLATSAPTIADLSGDAQNYLPASGAVVIDQGAAASVADIDSANFNSGTLTVAFAAGGVGAEDVLAIRNQGSGAGQIGVSGNKVTYAGTDIGGWTGGSGGSDLVVSFNGNANATNTSALIQNITYQNIDAASPTGGGRTVRFVLTDGDGGTSASYDTSVTVTTATAPATGTPYMISGTYVGDGTDNRAITVGFGADVIVIKSFDSKQPAVIRTSSMSGDLSKELDGTVALGADEIQSLDLNGFTIGTGTTVNKAGTTYVWTAFKASPGYMSVGSYTGNATAGRSVTGVGFSPELVYVLGSDATSPVFRSSADTNTYGFSLGGATANGVTALGSDGFTVGTSNTVNSNGAVYHYVAWNGVPGLMDVGSYSGTGADNRNLTGLGFQPELAVVKSDDSTNKTAVLHADAHGSLDDETMYFDKIAAQWDPDLIQQLQADGFQVGKEVNVNKNNGTYSYMAWRQQTPPTISAVANQSTDEDTPTPAIAFTVGDAETAAASLAVSGSSSNQALVPDANIVFGGSGANRTVTITPAANQSGSVTITLKAIDDFSEATRTFTLTVNPINDAPVNTVPGAQSTDQDTAKVFSAGNGNQISIADTDTSGPNNKVTLSVTNGSLTLAGTTGLTFAAGDGSADTTMTFRGTVANINTALNGLSYNPTANYNGSAVLTMTTFDSAQTPSAYNYRFQDGTPAGNSAVNIPSSGGITGVVSNFDVTALATALTGSIDTFGIIYTGSLDVVTAGTYTFYVGSDDGSILSIDGAAVVSNDGNHIYLEKSGTKVLTAGTHAIEIRYFEDVGTQRLTADYAGPDTGAAMTSLVASSTTSTVNLTVIPTVNVAPVNNVPGAQSTNEDTAKVFSSGNGNQISISDPGAGSAEQVTLAVTNGSLTLAGITGLTFTAGDGSADASMTFRGTVADINTALNGLSYSPTANYNGSASLTMTTIDSGIVSLDIDAGLTGRYTFDNPGDLGNDTSPLGANDGAPNLGTSATNDGTRGAVIAMTGVNGGGVQVSGLLGSPTNVTLAAWVNLTAADTGGAEIISIGDNIALRADNGAGAGVTGFIYNGTSYANITSGTYIAGTGWHHLAYTFDDTGNVNKLYIDGNLVASAASTNSISYTKGVNTQIGRHGNGGNSFDFNGRMDEVRVFDRALTAAEIKDLAADLALKDTDSVAITVNAGNDAPVVTITPSSYAAIEQTPLVLHGTGLSVADADAAAAPINLTLSVGSGNLTVGAGTTGVSTTGSGTNSVLVIGTLAQLNNLLAGNLGGTITYLNSSDTPPASTTFTLSLNDGGATGAGGPQTGLDTAVINITATNDAPAGVPTISGTPTEDQTLTANTGGISDADGLGAFSYQWLRGGVAIGGATANTYLLGDADVGAQISVQVSYTDGGGTAEGPLTSASVGPVANVNDAPVDVPAITGTASKGQTLTADASGISDADGLGSFSYQWLRGGVAIGGATGSTYLLVNDDVGTQITVQVSYTDGHGMAEGPLTSAPTAAVTNVNSPPSGVPTISGTPTEDQTLTANTGGISDADGLGAFTYQWLRDGSTIGGATANTYLLGDADVGAQISVEVRYTDGGGTAEGPLTSALTAVVANVNDAPVGIPTISGTASKGQTLTADASGISDADGLGAFSYQWLRNGSTIGGATANTYLLGDADVGAQISVEVRYTDGGGTAEGPLTSASVGPVANVNDPPVGIPTISGTASKGQTLTADASGISDADGLGTFSYQWLRGGVAIGGATGSTYLLVNADVGTQITVQVTYTDGHGTAEGPLISAPTALVTNVNTPPNGVPTISGTPTEDQTLTANTGGISDADGLGAFSYQWLRDGSTIGGATANTYLLGDADVGAQISVRVTYTDGGGTAEGPLTSVPVGPVANVNDAPAGVPTITGTASKGQTLTANTGGISDADGLGSFSYQWLRGGVAIGGATGSTYLLVNADVGTQITVQVTYTDGHGTAEGPLISAPTALVTNVNTPPNGVPTISGTATEDQTLTANTGGISDTDGLGTFSYQWLRGGVAIGGATASTYTLGDADVGAQLSVEVRYTDGGGTAEGPLTSVPVGPVANVNDAPAGVPTISGTASKEQTLTADASGIGDADGLGTFNYQWLRGGVAIGGATGSTYLLVNADVGAQISVQVTYTDGHGTAEGPLTSAPTAAVTNVNSPPSGVPTISGTASEDATLTANTGGISDADGLGAFSYQWLRNGSTIGGATANTYLLGDADVGAQVNVQVTYTDGGGTAEGPLTSTQVGPVANVNDAPVGLPAISGTASKGQTLTANTGGISDADGLGAFSYQWHRNGSTIGGATGSTYLLVNADVGTQITVQVTYTDGHGTAEGPLTSAPTAAVTNVNSPPSGVPTISGMPTEDQTLTANTGGISDADGLGTFSYQWLRDGSTIGGATANTYLLGDADVGAQISVRVTYIDGGGTAEGPLASASVGPVANVNDAPAGVPSISGTASKGQTLTANTGGISDADSLGAFSYQWLRNGSTIGGATGSTYLLVNADVGTQITVQVTYTDGHGTAEGPLTSVPTAVVTNVNSPPSGVPTISGTPTEDQTLTANTGGISDADGLGAFSYQWLRDGSTIGGATANTYLLGDADVGAQISVEVHYTDGGGTTEGPLTSTQVGSVANVNDAPAGVPTISGTATEDQTLTANTAGISDADGMGTFSYQWLRGGSTIGGATASTYTLGDADVGAQISVQVSYTDGGGTAEGPITSTPVGPVANVNDAPAGVPTITGTASKGQTLTANTGGISDADGLGAFSYQWLRVGVAIGGATGSTYLLVNADVGTQITVQVTYTDGHGTVEGPLTSAPTAVVTNVNSPPSGVPTISGTPTEDQTLTANTGGISDADGLGAFSYQWLRNGSTIGGATANTYLLGDADVGAQISLEVRYTDGGGTAEGPMTSASVGPVANVNDAPVGVPTINGTASKGQTLTADASGISDADGLGAFSYQWLRNSSTIGGATGSTYLLVNADVGTQISVQVTYTDGHGTAEGPLTSAPTAVVTNVNSPPSGVPTISGTASKGQTLTADGSGISDVDGLGTFNYQWLRGGVAIGGATGSTYLLLNADVGTQITVQVTYTDGHGTAEGPLTSAPTAPVSDVNTAAVIGGANSGSLTEDGILVANGNLTVSDPDMGEARFVTQAASAGTYGSFSIDAAGAWSYNLNNAAAVVQQLVAGQTVTDNFTVASADGTSATVTLTVTGLDDATVISGTTSGAVVEDTTLSASGNVTVSTSDAAQATFKAQSDQAGTYGSFSIDAAGAWNYNLDNAAAVVQQLAGGQTVTDSFTVASADGTTAIVAVTISGTNDAPVMTEATITLKVGEAVVLSPALVGAADVDGSQGNLIFIVTEVVNGHFEQADEPGATISSFSYADLVAGRVQFVYSGNGAAPAFRVAASDGSLTSAPLNARVVFDAPSVTNVAFAAVVVDPIATLGRDGARPGAAGNGVPAEMDAAQESAAAETERGVQAKTGTGESVDELQAENLERPLSAPPASAQLPPASGVLRGAMITLDDHSRTAVIEVATDITWDDYYLRLVSMTVADQLSSGRDAKLATGTMSEATGEVSESVSRELAVSAAQMTGIALTAGTVWWALRVGGLLTSLMATMPAWRHIDPLPILRDDEDEEVDWGDEDAEAARDEEAVDQVLDASGRGDQR